MARRLRTCLGYPGHHCAKLTPTTRCPDCARIHKPSSTERGYGTDHLRQRGELALTLPAYCWYGWCEPTRLFGPDDDWVAAHVIDGDDNSPRVVACRPCNEKAKRKHAQG